MDALVDQLDTKKRECVATRNLAEAKRVVIERYKVNIRRDRCRQMLECCQRILEQIEDYDGMKSTVEVLAEAKSTFRHVNMEEVSNKVGDFQDVFANFSGDIRNAQLAMSDISFGEDSNLSDAELKRELDELLSMEEEETAAVNGSAAVASRRPAPPATSTVGGEVAGTAIGPVQNMSAAPPDGHVPGPSDEKHGGPEHGQNTTPPLLQAYKDTGLFEVV